MKFTLTQIKQAIDYARADTEGNVHATLNALQYGFMLVDSLAPAQPDTIEDVAQILGINSIDNVPQAALNLVERKNMLSDVLTNIINVSSFPQSELIQGLPEYLRERIAAANAVGDYMAELEECSRLLGMDNHEGLTNVAGRLGTRLDADFDKLIALEARVAEYQTGMGESTAQIASLTYKLENTTNEWTAYLEALDQCATHLGLPAIASRLSVPDNLRHRLDANDSALKLHRDESVKLSARCEKLDETARQHLHEISELRNELYKGNNAAYAGADNLNAAAIAEIQRLQDVEGKHRDEISLLNTLLDKVAPGWSEVVDDRRAAVTDAIEGLAQQLKQYDAGSPEQRAAADRGKSAESQLQEIRAVLDRFVPGWGEDIEDLSNEVVVAVQRLVAKKPKPLWTSLEWANVHFAGGQRIVGFVVPALPAPALDTANRLPAIIDGTDPVYLNLPTAS